MSGVWNKINLLSPPSVTFKLKRPDPRLCNLESACSEIKDKLHSNETWKTECSLISRMIYRNKNKFRCDKGFQHMRTVKQLIQRFWWMDLETCVDNFSRCLPQEPLTGAAYLPSRPMLEYLLVRLMGAASLLNKISTHCSDAGFCFLQRLQLAHSWTQAALMLAMVARIRSHCEILLNLLCKKYNLLLPLVSLLHAQDVAWIPQEFTFPSDLSEWLGLARTPKQAARPPAGSIFSLIGGSGGDGEEEEEECTYFEPEVEPSSPAAHTAEPSGGHSAIQVSHNYDDDLGESLARDEPSSTSSGQKRPQRPPPPSAVPSDWHAKVTALGSIDELKVFLVKEAKSRNNKYQAEMKVMLQNVSSQRSFKKKKKVEKMLTAAKTLLLSYDML